MENVVTFVPKDVFEKRKSIRKRFIGKEGEIVLPPLTKRIKELYERTPDKEEQKKVLDEWAEAGDYDAMASLAFLNVISCRKEAAKWYKRILEDAGISADSLKSPGIVVPPAGIKINLPL